MDYVPFTPSMIPEASVLLAQRHQRNRAALPDLPARFEQPPVAARALETLLANKSAGGFAAIREGQLAAYLMGETTIQPWGRCGYVYMPGYALAQGASPDILQDLYGLLGETWNEKGCFLHYIYLCAADIEIIEAWFDLGFGKERVEALLDLRTADLPDVAGPTGIEIRPASKTDGEHLAGLSDTIWRHQTRAPRWHPMIPEDIEKHSQGWAEVAANETDMAFLAFEQSRAVGSLAFYLEEEKDDNMTVPPRCRYMTLAATVKSMRGRGIGTALAWYGLRAVRAAGADYCLTNWQSANLLAARLWPRFGFKPIEVRLGRTINPMIAWAKG